MTKSKQSGQSAADWAPQLSMDDLSKLTINLDIARTAFEEGLRKLQFFNAIRYRIQERGVALLRAFLTLTLAVVAIGAGLSEVKAWLPLAVAFAAAAPLLVAASCMFGVIWLRPTGAEGIAPNQWLLKGLIDGDEQTHAYLLATAVHDLSDDIHATHIGNVAAEQWLRRGIVASLLSPISCAAAVVVALSVVAG